MKALACIAAAAFYGLAALFPVAAGGSMPSGSPHSGIRPVDGTDSGMLSVPDTLPGQGATSRGLDSLQRKAVSQKVGEYLSAIVTEPIDYDFSCSYSHKGFFAQLYLGCPFAKRRTHRVTDTDVYWAGTSTFDRSQSRFVSISLRYTFDFGRKTDRINEEIDRNINSAILTSGTD